MSVLDLLNPALVGPVSLLIAAVLNTGILIWNTRKINRIEVHTNSMVEASGVTAFEAGKREISEGVHAASLAELGTQITALTERLKEHDAWVRVLGAPVNKKKAP